MRAYGFAGSGTLTLGAAGTITIGNTSQPDSASGIRIGGTLATLPVSLFTDDGFGAFVIQSAPHGWQTNAQDTSSTTGTIVVAAGTSLTLQKQSLSSFADYGAVPTGTKIATAAPLVTVPDSQGTPVNLTLKSDNILLDTGATIRTDPGAVITIAGTPASAGNVTGNATAGGERAVARFDHRPRGNRVGERAVYLARPERIDRLVGDPAHERPVRRARRACR